VASAYGYDVAFRGVGDDDPDLGTPTQLALFTVTGGAVPQRPEEDR
jgi:hypothetical protein